MKKMLKKLVTVIGCALMITACNGGTNVSNLNVDDDVIPIDQIIVDPDIPDVPIEIEEKTCKEIHSGSIGGSLIDLINGAAIEPKYTYTCSFSHEKTFTGEYTVKSDDRTIALVSHEPGTGSFTVKGITPGDAIIQAYTDEEELILQFVCHVRERIPMNKISNMLYNTDMFYGMFYGYKMSFISESPLKGVLVGQDDFESTKVNFSLIDGVEERIGNGTDFNTYKFKISVDPENSSTSRTYTYLYVSTTGDLIYVYYSNGLIDIFAKKVMVW